MGVSPYCNRLGKMKQLRKFRTTDRKPVAEKESGVNQWNRIRHMAKDF